MENNDDQCFKWAVTRTLHPVERDAGRISKILRKQSEKYSWEGLEFPVKVKDIGVFEKNNKMNVNVFSYDEESGRYGRIYTLRRISPPNYDKAVNLFFYDENYSVVKNLSRLVSGQKSKNHNKKYICERCLNHFSSDHVLQDHLEWCSKHDHLRHVHPSPLNNTEYFKNYQRMQKVPFAVYADFECFLPPVDNKIGQGTTQYQQHTPSGFCYTITCMDDNIYKSKTVLYTMQQEDEDIGRKFVESLEQDLVEVYGILTTPIPIRMTDADEVEFQNAETCYACKITLGNDKVRDHCHLTGKYRGAPLKWERRCLYRSCSII